MKLAEAKEEIIKLQEYVDTAEKYKPNSFESHCIMYYAILGNVNEVAKAVNQKGYTVGNRKVNSSDVSSVLKGDSKDKLHGIVKKIFTKNKKKNRHL
jgi:hypothetical protein